MRSPAEDDARAAVLGIRPMLMKKVMVAGLTVALALAARSRASAGSIDIRHDPVACVTVDRYARTSATGSPAQQVGSAELQFREGARSGWYAVRMAPEGDAWSGILPKPMRALERFEYRIVMTSADLEAASTAPFPVRVSDAADCPGATQSAEASIVVRVPAGAPVMPPVPAGFSPAGVVAAPEPATRGAWKTKWLVATGIAGGLGGAIAVAAAHPDANREPDRSTLTIEFPRTAQESAFNTAISVSRPTLVLQMRVSDGPRTPLDLLWRVEWHSPEHDTICIATGGTVSVAAAPRPVSVNLAPSRFEVSPVCGERFSVQTGHITVSVDGRLVFDDTRAMPYRFQP
jgi:hypothetical protein